MQVSQKERPGSDDLRTADVGVEANFALESQSYVLGVHNVKLMKIFPLCDRKALKMETQKHSGKFSAVSSSALKPAWCLMVFGMRQERGHWLDGKCWVGKTELMV